MISEYRLFALIEQLERNIGVLKDSYDRAKQRVKQLENENAILKKQLKQLEDADQRLAKKQIDLEKKRVEPKDFGKLVNNLSATDTNAELKQQLDEYIREIDRCIAHLSTLS